MNKSIISGKLVNDPELRRTTTNNNAVASFRVAVSREYVKQGQQREADFIPVVVWGKQAEFVHKYFKKGSGIEITGRIQTRSYEDAAGVKKYVTEIIAESVNFPPANKESNISSPSNEEDNINGDEELPF
jgi:single-strand DNA-binding protein